MSEELPGFEVEQVVAPEKVGIKVSGAVEWVGVAALACIVIVTVIDVIGDKVFSRPVAGNTEMIGLLQVVAISSGVAFSFVDGRQIYVGFLRDGAGGWKRAVIDTFCGILCLGFWAVAGWMLFEYGVALAKRGTGTALLSIPHYPFVLWIGVACAIPMCVLIMVDIVKAWRQVTGERG